MSKLNNATWGGMIAMGLRVDLYCDPCGTHEGLDMGRMPPDKAAIPMSFTCRCGRKASTIISPRSVEKTVPGFRGGSRAS